MVTLSLLDRLWTLSECLQAFRKRAVLLESLVCSRLNRSQNIPLVSILEFVFKSINFSFICEFFESIIELIKYIYWKIGIIHSHTQKIGYWVLPKTQKFWVRFPNLNDILPNILCIMPNTNRISRLDANFNEFCRI